MIILFNIHNSQSLRILGIFPCPLHSHTAIQQTIMKHLAARGHQVDVYSHFPLKNPPSNFSDFSLRDFIGLPMNNVTYDDVIKVHKTYILDKAIDITGYRLCKLLGHPVFQNLLKNPPKYDLVIIEVSLCSRLFALEIMASQFNSCMLLIVTWHGGIT